MTKQYIGFVNDHSGSMAGSRAKAAIGDYNVTIGAVKDAASREMLDTIVSVVAIGIGKDSAGREGFGTTRQVVVSNPHVLKPITNWPTPGGTPLYDGVGNMIELFKSLPDYANENVSFLVMTTTDGEEGHSSKYNARTLSQEIANLTNTGRWTFVFRVPKGHSRQITDRLGVSVDNVQEWETTAEGMAKSTVATTQAINSFYSARSAGAKGSNVFYANAANVTAADVKSALVDISKEIKLFVVPASVGDKGIEIKPFVEAVNAGQFLKGSAFYQLTKTEPRVQDTKLIIIRDRTNGKAYSGAQARDMIGLPKVGTVRLHPGDHGNFDLFIQSTSVNRKLVGNTGVIYWEKIGVPFTAADTAYLNGPVSAKKPAPKAPVVVQLPAVTPTNKPTASPLVPTPNRTYHASRSVARATGKRVFDNGVGTDPKRWYTLNN